MTESELQAWESGLISTNELGDHALHVTIASMNTELPIIFRGAEGQSKPPSSLGPLFADVSTITHLFIPASPINLIHSNPSPVFYDEDLIFRGRNHGPAMSHTFGLRPIATGYLFSSQLGIKSPPTSSVAEDTHTNITTCQVSVLNTFATKHSTLLTTHNSILKDILTNFHDLSVLTKERWHLSRYSTLPFHIASTTLMRRTVERGEARFTS
jgi:hypothetical protein